MSEPVYELEVRAIEEPHEVIGYLPVPYEAMQGAYRVVEFVTKHSYLDTRISTIALEVSPFAHPRTGHRWFALVASRDAWPGIKEQIDGAR